MIVFATNLLIAACRIEAQNRSTIKAPKLVRFLNKANDYIKSQDTRTERVELGSLRRLEQYVSDEITDMTNGYDLPD